MTQQRTWPPTELAPVGDAQNRISRRGNFNLSAMRETDNEHRLLLAEQEWIDTELHDRVAEQGRPLAVPVARRRYADQEQKMPARRIAIGLVDF